MSLNGLDATAVTEAYQSALGEGGAWFVPDAPPVKEGANEKFG